MRPRRHLRSASRPGFEVAAGRVIALAYLGIMGGAYETLLHADWRDAQSKRTEPLGRKGYCRCLSKRRLLQPG